MLDKDDDDDDDGDDDGDDEDGYNNPIKCVAVTIMIMMII